MKWVNRLYIFFLGIILTITTGFGIAAFYPQPISPSYPATPYRDTVPQSCYATPQSQAAPDCQKLIQKQKELQEKDIQPSQGFEAEQKAYQNKNAGYTRTAIFFGIVIGAIFAILGLLVMGKSKLLATGFLLGGVLTAVFTRLFISLASLGSGAVGTEQADIVAYMEFAVLLLLSVAVALVGLLRLSDQQKSHR